MSAPSKLLQSMPTPAAHHDHCKTHGHCNICLEDDMNILDFSTDDSYGFTSDKRHVRLECGHAFHSECMKNQLTHGSSQCPTCQKRISDHQIDEFNAQMGTSLQRRTARNVMEDIVDDDRRNGRNTTMSRENRALWGFDVIHREENEQQEQTDIQSSAPNADFDFLDNLLLDFTAMNLLRPTIHPATSVRTSEFIEPTISEWFADLIEEELDFGFAEEPQSYSYYFDEPGQPTDYNWACQGNLHDCLFLDDFIYQSFGIPELSYHTSYKPSSLFPDWSRPFYAGLPPFFLAF